MDERQPRPRPKSSAYRPLIPIWGWIAAAVLMLLTGYTAWRSEGFDRQFVALQQRAQEEQQIGQALQAEQLRYQRAINIVAAKSTKRLQFKFEEGHTQATNENGSAVRAYWNPQMGLVLSADKMPQMPADRTLQLWLMPQTGAPASAAIFSPDANGQIFLVMPPTPGMDAAKALAISDEPAGGSPQPTTTPVWTAALP